jgi:hypothetical protein
LVEDQVSVEDEPFATVVGFAVIETAGNGGGGPFTVTVADALALPPAPVQVMEKLVVVLTAPLLSLPEVAFVPDQPPEAVQEFAPVDDQLRVEAWPLATVVGFAMSDAVGVDGGGAGGAGGVPPPPPPQCASRKHESTATNKRAALLHIPAKYGFRNMSLFPPPLIRIGAGTFGG